MLLELEIENLALMARARADLAPGMNALTGETGAGKTLVLRALGLLRGQRADRTHVRDGASECRVAGLFRVPESLKEEILETLAPIELEEGDELLMVRTVAADGRSRCYANGRLVAQGVLKAVGQRLIDMLGQGEARLLSETEHRARMLDAYGGLYEEYALYLAARERAIARRERRDRLHREQMQRRQRLDYLRFVSSEIEAIDPKPGEVELLSRELEILEAASALEALCAGSIEGLYEAEGSAHAEVTAIARKIEALNPGARSLLADASDSLLRAAVEIEEATRAFRSALERIAADPRRQEGLSARLDDLQRLLDRFGPTEDRLFAAREEARSEISSIENDESDCESADAELAAATEELARCSRRLDDRRTTAGQELGIVVERELKRLGMEQARFQVTLVPHAGDTIAAAELSGPSRIEFLLQANPGLAAKPLEDVASGGEAARIALALQSTLADVLDVPTLVFDEIESGIGSRLGEIVADCIADIANRRQVIVVTHIPAVAARAARHFKVEKRSLGVTTESSVRAIEGDDRELEIATMASGEKGADEARRIARQLLERAGAPRPPTPRPRGKSSAEPKSAGGPARKPTVRKAKGAEE